MSVSSAWGVSGKSGVSSPTWSLTPRKTALTQYCISAVKHEMRTFDDCADDASHCESRVRRGFASTVPPVSLVTLCAMLGWRIEVCKVWPWKSFFMLPNLWDSFCPCDCIHVKGHQIQKLIHYIAESDMCISFNVFSGYESENYWILFWSLNCTWHD